MTEVKVNKQILDSVLSVNEIVLGSSAASAMSTMYINLAQSAGLASQNAVANQQHLNILASAAIAAGTNSVLASTQKSDLEQLTPTQRLDYLQKLMKLTEPGAPAPASDSDQSKTAGPSNTIEGDSTGATV